MVIATIRVTGASDLAKALGVAQKQAPLLVRQVTQKAALDLEAEAKRNAPVRTGRLKNSITTSQAGLSRADVGAGVTAAVYEVGPTVDYAPFLEFGTRYMQPQPFLYPAADKIQPIFERAIEKAVESLL